MIKLKKRNTCIIVLLCFISIFVTGCEKSKGLELIQNIQKEVWHRVKLKEIRVEVIKKEKVEIKRENKSPKTKYNVTFKYEEYVDTINDMTLYDLLEEGDKVNANLFARKKSDGTVLKTYFLLNSKHIQ